MADPKAHNEQDAHYKLADPPVAKDDISMEEGSSRLAAPSTREETSSKKAQEEVNMYRIKAPEGNLTPLDTSDLIIEDRREIEAAIEAYIERKLGEVAFNEDGTKKKNKFKRPPLAEENCPQKEGKQAIKPENPVRCPRCWNGNAAACKKILYCIGCAAYACNRCWDDFDKTKIDKKRYDKRGGKVRPPDGDETVE